MDTDGTGRTLRNLKVGRTDTDGSGWLTELDGNDDRSVPVGHERFRNTDRTGWTRTVGTGGMVTDVDGRTRTDGWTRGDDGRIRNEFDGRTDEHRRTDGFGWTGTGPGGRRELDGYGRSDRQ